MLPVSRSPLVALEGIVVDFPGVRALDDVDFRLFPGEVHALMGENGAGKSTLVGVLTGTCRPSSGTVTVDGAARSFSGVAESRSAGSAADGWGSTGAARGRMPPKRWPGSAWTTSTPALP
jgi:monosaccharide-transporting ATPase